MFTLSALLLTSASLAWAQPEAPPGVPPGMASRLASERMGPVQPGLYSAGDGGSFMLASWLAIGILMRISGEGRGSALSLYR